MGNPKKNEKNDRSIIGSLMRKFFFTLLFVLILPQVYAQYYEYIDIDVEGDTVNIDEEDAIDIYDEFNPVLGGDSVRFREEGIKYTGWFEEYYQNKKLKHKGYYNNGLLTTIYKNYFDNGQLERSFKVNDIRFSQMEIYYKNGVLKSKVTYFKGQALIWIDYYSNGNMEYYEENNKSFEFCIAIKYFFESGNPQSCLELTDKKKKIYDSKEYWENGILKEGGEMIFNKSLNDYQKIGTWVLYDNTGNKIGEEDYIKGQMNEERKY